MADMIRRDTAIDELERIRYKLLEIDIPSPTVPEYIEHHEQVQSVMKAVTESVDRIFEEPVQSEIICCKDCKHHWTHKCMDSMPIERCDLEQTFYDAEHDFCSLAERRTDE